MAHPSFSFTRSLGINCYSFFQATDQYRRKEWIRRINNDFSEKALTRLLKSIADRIGAKIMHLSSESFVPQGVSASVLIAQQVQNSVLGHLDNSHLSVHTYASYDTNTHICTFRADFDITTCGEVSPLEALDLIFENGSDLLVVDYRIRGDKTSDLQRVFLEADAMSGRFLPKVYRERYECKEMNLPGLYYHHALFRRKDAVSSTLIQEKIAEFFQLPD